jgi:hypothetical protein
MAQIDPSIAMGFRQPQIQDPIAATIRAQEVGVNALKMQEMQRGVQTQNKLRELYSQGVDVSTPEGFKQLAAVDPATAMKLRTDALQGQKLQGEIKKTGFELTEKGMNIMRERTKDVIQNPSNENYIAHIQEGLRDGLISPEQAQRSVQTFTAVPPDQRVAFLTQSLAKAEKLYESKTISEYQKQSLGVQREGQAITREGQRMQYDPQLQARIAEAKAAGEFMGKSKATAAAALPGALEAAKEGIRLIDEMVGQAEVKDKSGKVITKGTKPHPGFSEYVGGTLVPGKRFLEGTDVAGFEVRQKQIEGKAFLEAFQTLKGGGAITEKEGEKGTAAIMRMNKASNEKEYTAAARELQEVLRSGMDRAKAKAGNVAPSGGGGSGGNVVDYNSLN